MSRRLLAALLCVPLAAPGGTGAEPPRVPVGAKLGAFRLKDTSDNPRSPADFRDSKAVVLAFLGIDCPLNTAYMPRLVELARQYQPKGVAFLGINSNRHDSLAEVTEHARKFRVPFPVCKDFGNKVADLAGAERTPEVVVLDAAGVIRYRGRIDDQYGYLPGGQSFQRPAPTRRDLAEALEEILAGKPVSVPETKSDGCLIARERPVTDAEAVTYTRDVAPIIQKRCLECHREGQI
ncbi:MAG TPA: thioredoxin family protein, partial [Gemmataceae bacterium]